MGQEEPQVEEKIDWLKAPEATSDVQPGGVYATPKEFKEAEPVPPPFMVREYDSEIPIQIPSGKTEHVYKQPVGIRDRWASQERVVEDVAELATVKFDFQPPVNTIVEVQVDVPDEKGYEKPKPVYFRVKDPLTRLNFLDAKKRVEVEKNRATSVYVERVLGPQADLAEIVKKAKQIQGGFISTEGLREQLSPDAKEVWVTKIPQQPTSRTV